MPVLPEKSILNSAAVDLYQSRLVVDASATINLLGTGVGHSILEATPSPVLMANQAYREVRRHPIGDRNHVNELREWQGLGLLTVVSLSAEGVRLLDDPTGANLASNLDDGEAATIAYAVCEGVNSVPVIDERKATRLFRDNWPERRLIDTVTLFRLLVEMKGLSLDTARDAIYSALVHARMRVTPEMQPWVIDLIGRHRAAECPSLPVSARTPPR